MSTEKIASRGRVTLLVISILGLLIMLAGGTLAGLYAYYATQTGRLDWVDLPGAVMPGVFIAGVGLLMAVLAWVLGPLTAITAQRAADDRWRFEQIAGALENQRQMLESLRDAASLSDAAKHIAYRHKDHEALREAIREEQEKGDFETALSLANDMEHRFGYHREAQQFRTQINAAAQAAAEREVSETVGNIEVLMKNHDWDESFRQYDRLAKQYPDHPGVKRIPERIQAACNAHKRELLSQWKDAVARDDVDRSIGLLKELDRYISPGEAEAYKESARDVFRKRLQQMGVQFALHVHDKSWAEAVRVGRQIMDEYPNTRIAAEVKEKWDILQERAREAAGVGTPVGA